MKVVKILGWGKWRPFKKEQIEHDRDKLGVYELGDENKNTVYYGIGRIKTRLLDHLSRKECLMARYYRFELFSSREECRARERKLLEDYIRKHGRLPICIEIRKSSRHPKIIGDFGENLICNWLSRSGFEVSIVDHTGIDIVAYNTKAKKRLGITVKSRTRTPGREKESVNLFDEEAREKLLNACEYFGCEAWIGVYVETTDYADVFLTSLVNYDSKYRRPRQTDDWKMGSKHIEDYDSDKNVMHLCIKFEPENWFPRVI